MQKTLPRSRLSVVSGSSERSWTFRAKRDLVQIGLVRIDFGKDGLFAERSSSVSTHPIPFSLAQYDIFDLPAAAAAENALALPVPTIHETTRNALSCA